MREIGECRWRLLYTTRAVDPTTTPHSTRHLRLGCFQITARLENFWSTPHQQANFVLPFRHIVTFFGGIKPHFSCQPRCGEMGQCRWRLLYTTRAVDPTTTPHSTRHLRLGCFQITARLENFWSTPHQQANFVLPFRHIVTFFGGIKPHFSCQPRCGEMGQCRWRLLYATRAVDPTTTPHSTHHPRLGCFQITAHLEKFWSTLHQQANFVLPFRHILTFSGGVHTSFFVSTTMWWDGSVPMKLIIYNSCSRPYYNTSQYSPPQIRMLSNHNSPTKMHQQV